MEYQLHRSKRKTIAISVNRDGNIIVRAPLYAGIREIETFLLSKQNWLEAAKQRILEEKREYKTGALKNGMLLPLLDHQLELTIYREERTRITIKSIKDRILIWSPYYADNETLKDALEKWYKKQAKELLIVKTQHFANKIGVRFEDLHIRDQKSRWGSCSSKGNLNFNWRILMAPESVCDYVVIHELCHLLHMDHSKQFWQTVAIYCIDYKEAKDWLAENGKRLYF